MSTAPQDVPVPGDRKKALFWSLLVLVPVAFTLTSGEIYTRATRPHLNILVLTGRRIGPSPRATWAQVDAFSAYRGRPGKYGAAKTINLYGFISTPDLTIVKPRGAVRIVFLGESSTAGTGPPDLPDSLTWPWQATDVVRRHAAAGIQFINGALSGYTTFESLGRLWNRIRYFSPDAIVVYHGWNEMYYFNGVDEMFSWRTLPDGSWTLDRTASPVVAYRPLWIDRLIWPSQLLTYARLKLSNLAGSGEVGTAGGGALSSHYDARGPETFRANLRLLKEAARPEYFYDHVHFTEAGARAIAQIVARAILPAVVKRVAAGERR